MRHGKHMVVRYSSRIRFSPSQVSVVLSHLVPVVDIRSTDLVEARAIAAHNIRYADHNRTNSAKIAFSELDWEQPLYEGEDSLFNPLHGDLHGRAVDLVVAADCIYNADSRSVFDITTVRLMLTYLTVQHL